MVKIVWLILVSTGPVWAEIVYSSYDKALKIMRTSFVKQITVRPGGDLKGITF